jgi:serine/threonine protein kinase
LLDVSTFGPFQKAICPHCSIETHVKREFGSYRLEQRYAIGGMSVIFVGRDTTLDRKVAIKVLNEEYCNDEIRIQAFENEARLTAQVSHPNVVKVYAVGRAYGRFYLVMELLEGCSFERIMGKRGALPENEVLDIGTQVASGLQAAKRAGMIHRDVKPGNILIDSEGRARLVDFGLALITKDGHAQAEEVWATPYYVPPEALERGIEDFRSDIYAFGATLYHALAGRPPFESTSTSNNVLRRAKQTIPRLCTVAPWISPNTGEAIDRMMAFKPEHRWSSYGDVLKALNRAKRTIGEAPRAAPIHGQTRRQRRQKGSGFALVFIVTLVSLAAILALWQPWNRTTNPPNPDSGPLLGETKEPALNPNGPAWKPAREAIANADYKKAQEAFLTLSKEANLTRPDQSWAFLEGAVCAFLEGKPAKGRTFATQALAELKSLNKNDNTVIEMRRLAQLLRRIPPPTNRDFPRETNDLKSAMGTFALALKQWEQGQWETALPGFARVRSATLPPELAWFKTYQSIADTYLADGQILSDLKDLPSPKNADEASGLIGQLSEAADRLRTKGRALYNLRARQAYLARLRKSFSKSPDDPEISAWKALLPVLAKQGLEFKFAAIAETLSTPPPDTPNDALWAWRFLQKGATAFLDELIAQGDWAAQKKDETPVTPTACGPEGLTLEDGTFVPWTDLEPKSLIVVHTGEKANAVAFAWLVGLTSVAEEKAEELAGRDPDFQDNWKRVLIGTSL